MASSWASLVSALGWNLEPDPALWRNFQDRCAYSMQHKVRISSQRTTVSQEWLAEELQMRSAANVSQLLRRAQGKRGRVPRALTTFVAGAMEGKGRSVTLSKFAH